MEFGGDLLSIADTIRCRHADFLKAIRNPKHEEHTSVLEWIGGRFDSEAFDPEEAANAMKEGLPDKSMK
ncbi:MAG: hypothetical protein AB7O38_11855 [Pirellulaceae bacterium]